MYGFGMESGKLFNYMMVDIMIFICRNFLDKFKCFNVCFNYNNGLVVLDFSFYYYCLCICDVGYYGLGKICLFCMLGVVCKD